METSEAEPRELAPKLVFTIDGRLHRFRWRKNITREVKRDGAGVVLEKIGIINNFCGHRFHLDIRSEPFYIKDRKVERRVFWLVLDL